MIDDDLIRDIRAFNRAYTNRLGLLGRDYLNSPYTLTEARILYEIGAADAGMTAAALCATLHLDPAYLSRIIKAFRNSDLVLSRPAPNDRRSQILYLTEKGLSEFRTLGDRSDAQIAEDLVRLDSEQLRRVAQAVTTLRRLIDPNMPAALPAPAIIRPCRTGDIGWLIEAQAIAYRRDQGFDHRFEGLVAQIAGDFLSRAPSPREACWIAEAEGERLGSIMVTEGDAQTAKLRLLFVERRARGLGLGRALVRTVIDFARGQGYRQLTLWTNDVLKPALKLYETSGFHLAKEEPHDAFGVPGMSQTWVLDLLGDAPADLAGASASATASAA
ncbi:hypothetical protein BJF92_10775 [Rhizobium rhizosphaerae]|uniref:MarR family transcriptional regulator n=1 Tax=Xaviernesmea rhizosphaerae TaxID=1672749 RepID=A0A1Q9AMK0_9HYPH|nr:helix-turn-helix domain-containing GNAT family N-acetyltransferase [Xaviernesmea rhizosphaerae]OLP56575.1 hypothetical protein BJF92_10775 [Xaviernesmea rhizosphaerae]